MSATLRRPALLLEALGIRAALPVLLRTLPLDRVLESLTPPASPQGPQPGALEPIERITASVARLTRTACLKRSLMRYRMLRRRGYPVSFVIGMRPGGSDGFEAHAWVSLNDEPLMETEPVDYRESFIWPARPGAPPVTESVTAGL